MKINQKRPDFGHFKNRYLGRVEDPEGESSKEVTWREKSCDRTQRESCHGYSKQKRFRHLGSIQWNYLCHIWTAIKLCKDFEALCEMLSEFSSGHICACYSKLGQYNLDGANLQMQTYLVLRHQKWPYFLWQLYFSQIGYTVLVPGLPSGTTLSSEHRSVTPSLDPCQANLRVKM